LDALAIETAEGDDFLNFYIKPTKKILIMTNEKVFKLIKVACLHLKHINFKNIN
jgi:hypothetical protein